MEKECSVYIDEAGDLGVRRGTQWFVLTAVIVDQEDEPQIREILKSVRNKLNLNTIHFRNLSGFEQRAFVVNSLSDTHFEYINIIIDTNKLDLSRLRLEKSERPGIILYNYACRYLIERVSWLLRDTERRGKIVLSSRGTSRDGELIEYLKEKLIDYPQNEITDCFLGICSKQAESWDMLQLADICAASTFYYHEIHGKYGFLIPCYTYKLQKFLYRRNGATNRYGMKYYTDDMKPDAEYFRSHMVCK